ncbi:acetyltransferase [Roseivivax halodurans JCM 10272]|uniref:Acetyltransferase n=1 Tax=Roseivivax halodurans JCM 10272 TaxID=1449350 RepID=X7EJU8_9RHOB|nr:GNAT family N-acetyltransferase [Roseivivax halodurans]ETX15426.1 acetyltransferase [Roseivivax halodurans JCM 10272]
MDVRLREFGPADADWLVEAHGTHYAAEEGFDASFARLVRRIVDDFLASHDPGCERGWIAEADGTRLGCIFCVNAGEGAAKLRLFLLMPEARGQGLGRHLLQTCMGWARERGYTRMVLWTHESHRAACALYARTGWSCVSSRPVHSFGQDLVELHWEIAL